jgi:cell division protein FtsZ
MTKKIKETSSKKETAAQIKKGQLPSGSLSAILSERKDLQQKDFKPKLAVIGVGGAGGNAINNLVKHGLENVTTIACNTDAQALETSFANTKIQLGPKLTKGHGAGANAQVGKLAAEESEDEIRKHLEGMHMIFVVAGLGGGTGGGAGPKICEIALSMGILTIGFVTTPFEFEGMQRKRSANDGLEQFQDNCDVLIVVGNQNLFSLSNESTTFLNAFALTDEVLCSGVQSVVRTISESGLINTDLADFFTIIKGRKSRARMGTGSASGEDRGAHAAQEAMASPLLELGGMMAKDVDGVIICIRCGQDMTLNDINQAVDYIKQSVSEDANIIFGATIDESMKDKVQVSIFATSSNSFDDDSKGSDKYNFTEYSKEDQENLKVETFEELLADDIEVGRSHQTMLHEDNLNTEDQYIVTQKKTSVLSKFKNMFKKSSDDIPPYLKKKD